MSTDDMSEPAPICGESENSFGPLTLDDLENRAEAAFRDHIDTYTASTVLHRMRMAELDEHLLHVLATVQESLECFRETVTRKEWHRTQQAWADAAGFSVPPAIDDTAGEASDETT